MSANINITNKKASFVSAKEKARHGLGTILPDKFNSEDAIKYGGLDYEVALCPIEAKIQKTIMIDAGASEIINKRITLPKNFATYRTDTNQVFGIVGARYTVVQNKDAFKFFDAIVGEGEAIFETAGALGRGETVFLTAKLPDYISVKGDEIEKYVVLTMSHDGSGAIQALFTPIRVVCANTLSAALRTGKNKVTIRHTKSANSRLEEAHKIMGITNKLSLELQQIFEASTKVNLNDKEVEKALELSLGLERDGNGNLSTKANNVLESALDFYQSGVGQSLEICKGTLYGFYQGLTGYLQHNKSYKNEEVKMNSLLFGSSADIAKRGLDFVQYALK